MRRFAVGLLVLVSALAVILASTSLWTRRHVINTEVFVADTQAVLAEPAVRARISQRVTEAVIDRPDVQAAMDDVVAALPERLQRFGPTVEDGVRSLLESGVQRLVASDAFNRLTGAALTSVQSQLVSGQPVEFTLGMAKDRIDPSRLTGLAGQVLDLVPDDVGITLVTPADAPQLYSAIDLLEVAWWWFALLALITFVIALAVSRRRRGTLRAWSVTTLVLGLLVLVTLRVLRGPVIAAARPENRDALAAAWDLIVGTLRVWTVWVVVAALVLTVLTVVWGRLGIVSGVRRASDAAVSRYRRSRAARAEAAAATAAAGADGEPAAPPPAESWGRRVAAATSAFFAGLEVDRRADVLGGWLAPRLRQARWAGVAVGAVVLLLWPSPTLSVLIWVAAFVALYLALVEWLVGRAPAPVAAVEATSPVPAPPAAGPAGTAPLPAAVPAPREAVAARVGAADAVDGRVLTLEAPPAPAVPPPAAPPAAEALKAAAFTPDVLSGLGGRLDLLVRLGAARDAGVLSPEEFEQEKRRLLDA
jgi:hypothetical protein